MKDLSDYKKFQEYLGNERYYHDYLVFFQGEIEKKGHGEVINEYLMKGDERADDMLCRLYAGKFSDTPVSLRLTDCLLQRISASDHTSRLWSGVQAAFDHRRSFGASRGS